MANMMQVLNTILAQGSEMYQSRVPQATKDNLSAVGTAIMSAKVIENEFLTSLVEKVAMTIVHNKTFHNPLAIFKKGKLPMGRNLEEIYTNPVTGQLFDPSGKDLLTAASPDVKAIYHTRNRQGKYTAKISKSQLISAFTSYQALEKLLNQIVTSIYSGDNLEEMMLMKELFSTGIEGGKIKSVDFTGGDVSTTEGAKNLVKLIKTIGLNMTEPSSAYNSYYDINHEKDPKPAITWTPMESQILVLRNDVAVNIDMELLANAYNTSYAEMKQRIVTVANFGSNTRCGAVLCDEALVQVYDNLEQMENFHNGDGLFDKWMYHHWQTYSLSLFANAMAFMLPEPTEGTSVEDEQPEPTE